MRAGLTATPKELPPKYFYDDRGSELFDEITRLPEYYPTRAERAILEGGRARDRRAHQRRHAVELGSGTSEKTRLLLDALDAHGTLERFVPFDVSEATLRSAAARGRRRVLDRGARGRRRLRAPPPTLPGGGTRLVAFLGSTIGNLTPAARAEFLAEIAAGLEPGDAFLLGTDLVKDLDRLVAAYDDAAGVTAEFNRNVLHVVNRNLDADFDPDGSPTSPGGTPTRSGSRCGSAPTPPQTGAGRGPRPHRGVRRRRGHAHRDQRQVHPGRGSRPSSPPPASASTPGGPIPPAISPSP